MNLVRSFVAAALAGSPALVVRVGAEPTGRSAPEVYASLCASCHGDHLEGGKGPSLVSGVWRHGGDDAALERGILDGYPDTGMPAFAKALGPADVRALITFLRETAVRRVEPTPAASGDLPGGVQSSEVESYRMESLAEGLDVPWSLAFLPGDRILVTERVGRLRVIDHGQLQPEPIADVPPVVVRDEAGLMSVAVPPDYAQSRWVYLTFSDPGPNDTAMTKVIRGRIRDGRLVDQQAIFEIPRDQYPPGHVLFGCRLVFDGAYLFISVGERGVTGAAQDPKVPFGKIHRVFADGRIPPDNPWAGVPGACRSIWALGVRNPQGLARDPRDGALWESEHGPRGGDELNWIRRGLNYGWPAVTFGMNYDGTPVSAATAGPGFEPPVKYWTPSIATSELEFYTGDGFPHWKGNLFLGSLAQQKLLRLTIDPATHAVTHVEEIFHHLGRIRDIKTGPDGLVYLALELVGRPGRVVRLVPAGR
ncbi:MAG TPA: PQQ-dependent sugar dehydrogenase [Lacunisphaera sp.]|nr:PQQ-dependent sugar dehydrogenase [Lacunisphaera sp.]